MRLKSITSYFSLENRSRNWEGLLEEIVVQGEGWLPNLLEGCVDAAVEDRQRREDRAVEVAQPLPHLTLQQQ